MSRSDGLALGLGGDSEGALAELEPLAETGFAPVFAHCAYYRLKLGDLGAAEAHAVAATAANPLEQTAWAYLTVIWRLLDDPREKWLADYERLVIPLDISAPAGFANIGAFMDESRGRLERASRDPPSSARAILARRHADARAAVWPANPDRAGASAPA